MFQLKYKDEFIDLLPDQEPEIERNSPLFLIDDYLSEKTSPVTIAYSDKNCRLIGNIFFELSERVQTKIAVKIYDKGTYKYNAVLVIESAGMHGLHVGKGNATGYMLLGISSFFTDIKDKLLTDLALGGVRTLNYTTADPDDASGGYWQAFKESWDFEDDYVIAPYRNEAFTDDDIEFTYCHRWGNKFDGETLETRQPVIPWPKFEYVLNQIFEEAGWKLDTTGINDEDWKKIILYSNYLVSTCGFGYGAGVVVTRLPTVEINLALAMPKDVKCSTFIFEWCKRLLWAPIFVFNSNTCRLVALKEMRNKTPKDWTRYAKPTINEEFSTPEKIFAFKNTFEGEDQYPTAGPDLKMYPQVGFFNTEYTFPDSNAEDFNGYSAYTFVDNKYWRVFWDAGTNTYSWGTYADNIYDEAPENATDTFETKVTPLPCTKAGMENGHFGLIPIVSHEKRTPWGIRAAFWHGMVKQVDGNFAPLSIYYPCALSTNTPPGLTPKLTWSNVYKHDNFEKDYGIMQYWASRWMKMIAPVDKITREINLPLHELMQFKWDDLIIIHNLPYVVKSFVEPVSYKNKIQAVLQRVKLFTEAIVEEPGGGTDVHFNGYTTISGSAYYYEALQYVVGEPFAEITIELILLTKSNAGFYFKVNNTELFTAGETFTVTLDADGNGDFNVKLGGVAIPMQAILSQVQITATDIGSIGSPDTTSFSKLTG